MTTNREIAESIFYASYPVNEPGEYGLKIIDAITQALEAKDYMTDKAEELLPVIDQLLTQIATLRGALERLKPLNLGDYIYNVRENIDLDELPEGASSWEHPKVVEFGAAIAGIDEALSGLPAAGVQANPVPDALREISALAGMSLEYICYDENCLNPDCIRIKNTTPSIRALIKSWMGGV